MSTTQLQTRDAAPDMVPFLGPVLIGTLEFVALWAIVWLQTFMYFFNASAHRKDSVWIKGLVIWLLLSTNTALGLLVTPLYRNAVLKFGNYAFLDSTTKEYMYILIVGINVAVCVQTFFIYRIWILSHKNIWLWVVFVPCALFELLSNIIFTVKILNLKTLTEAYGLDKIILGCYVVAPVVDMGIAVCLILYINKEGNTQLTSTKDMIYRLAIISINTGVWTSVVAIATMILTLTTNATNYYAIAHFPSTALYVNSCLANLNARDYIRNGASPPGVIASTINSAGFSNMIYLNPMQSQQPTTIQGGHITITTEQTKQSDADHSGMYKGANQV